MTENNENKPNGFVRFLIIVLSLFIIALISYTFFCTTPSGVISSGIITLICILLVLVLSESFDNFSIGKLMDVSRETKKKQEKIDSLNTENSELRNQLVSVATSVSQNQSSTNIMGVTEEMLRSLIVQKASIQEVQEQELEEDESKIDTSTNVRRRPDFRKIESLGLSKFILQKGLDENSVIQEAKLVTQFQGIDEISNSHLIFDGYSNLGNEEIFIEVKPDSGFSIIWRDRIYIMLNKINLYRKIKDSKAHLVLVMVKVPVEEFKNRKNWVEEAKAFFEPAITNGLLRIHQVTLSPEEAEEVMVQK